MFQMMVLAAKLEPMIQVFSFKKGFSPRKGNTLDAQLMMLFYVFTNVVSLIRPLEILGTAINTVTKSAIQVAFLGDKKTIPLSSSAELAAG